MHARLPYQYMMKFSLFLNVEPIGKYIYTSFIEGTVYYIASTWDAMNTELLIPLLKGITSPSNSHCEKRDAETSQIVEAKLLEMPQGLINYQLSLKTYVSRSILH